MREYVCVSANARVTTGRGAGRAGCVVVMLRDDWGTEVGRYVKVFGREMEQDEGDRPGRSPAFARTLSLVMVRRDEARQPLPARSNRGGRRRLSSSVSVLRPRPGPAEVLQRKEIQPFSVTCLVAARHRARVSPWRLSRAPPPPPLVRHRFTSWRCVHQRRHGEEPTHTRYPVGPRYIAISAAMRACERARTTRSGDVRTK